MEGGMYTDEAEARTDEGQLLRLMNSDELKLMRMRERGMLVPVVLVGVEPAIIMARRVPTTTATCVR